MKKPDLGQSINTVANVGVILGIVLLAVELRQNNELLGAQARASREAVAIDSANIQVTTPELWRALMKEENGDPLSSEEEYLLKTFNWGRLRRLQYAYGEYRAGLIERADIPTGDWRALFSSGSVMEKLWQEDATKLFRPDFVQFMDEEIIGQPSE